MGSVASVNKFGLDAAYFRAELLKLRGNMQYYRPDELSRALTRLAFVADSDVASETLEGLTREKKERGR